MFNINNPPAADENPFESMGMEELLEEVKGKGTNFPKDWEQFDDRAKTRAMVSYLGGGLTPLGFETLTPDWLDQIQEIGDRAQKALDEIGTVMEERNKSTLH
jgi:hypothetical protein